MKKLSPKGIKTLKLVHIVLSAMWFGGGVAVTLMPILRSKYSNDAAYGIYIAMQFVDNAVIIPGAVGSVITGLIYSLFTGWGFTKHRWITCKWIFTVAMIIFGAAFLSPWVTNNCEMLKQGTSVLTQMPFLQNENNLKVGSVVQTICVVGIMMLSVFKPFSKKQPLNLNKPQKQIV